MKNFVKYLFLVVFCLSVPLEPGSFTRVIDGDTVELYTVGVPNRERVRLLGVNTPEKGQVNYNEAKAFTKTWISSGKSTLNAQCKRDSFGRLLGTLTKESGEDLGTELIKANLAVPFEK